LLEDFVGALELVQRAHPQFLMAGRRWDTDITEPIDFSRPNWREEARHRAVAAGHQHNAWTIDYFAFRRGLYGADTQPLAIGRFWWDHWLIRKALDSRSPVIDSSRMVLAIHQNHDFGHHPQGWQGISASEDARRNWQIVGGRDGARILTDATLVLRDGEIKKNRARRWGGLQRQTQVYWWEAKRVLIYKLWLPVWHSLLGVTRPVRSALGLRKTAAPPARRP